MGPVDTSFGSDKYGLVCGYRFTPGDPATAIDCEGAERVLAERAHGARPAAFLWRHFSLANVAGGFPWPRTATDSPSSWRW